MQSSGNYPKKLFWIVPDLHGGTLPEQGLFWRQKMLELFQDTKDQFLIYYNLIDDCDFYKKEKMYAAKNKLDEGMRLLKMRDNDPLKVENCYIMARKWAHAAGFERWIFNLIQQRV